MDIKVSELTGFCFGVKQAVDLSKGELSKKNGKVYSIGPLIHNPQVVDELQKSGLKPVSSIEEIDEGTIIISSHGSGAKLKAKENRANLKIIDATCPFVKRIQEEVKKLYEDGYTVVIIGKREHPEIRALAAFTEGKAIVINNLEEAKNINPWGCGGRGLRIGVVSQSTYSQDAFLEILSILLQKPFLELRIFNTICKDTIRRQQAVRRLVNVVDMMIVVGGKDSANTHRLVEVCKKMRKTTYHIEDSSDIAPSWLIGRDSVGIASGASTPDWVVQEVIKKIRGYG